MKRRVLFLVFSALVIFFGYVWHIGAWNLIFPKNSHDSIEPELPKFLNQPSVLVFSKTNQFRHKDSIKSGQAYFSELTSSKGLGVFLTENGASFNPGTLANFDVVVFLNVTGDVLNASQRKAFQQWLVDGGGWLGIHAAGDGSHVGWDWYMKNLVGATFTAHTMGPQFQEATILSEAPDHPVMFGLPKKWQHLEEWYSWDISPRQNGFLVFAGIDEKSYSPEERVFFGDRDLRMGDHPVVWGRCLRKGRSVYVAMGHKAEAFESQYIAELLSNAIDWLISEKVPSSDCSPHVNTKDE